MALLIFLPYFRWWAWGSVKLSNLPKIRGSWWSQAFISKCSYSRMYAFNCYTIPIYLHHSEYLTSTYLAPGSCLVLYVHHLPHGTLRETLWGRYFCCACTAYTWEVVTDGTQLFAQVLWVKRGAGMGSSQGVVPELRFPITS